MTAGFDASVPNMARVYAYWLGGKDHYAADRAEAERLLAIYPQLRDLVRENRTFLTRAVSWAAGQGISQFVDLGAGLPAVRRDAVRRGRLRRRADRQCGRGISCSRTGHAGSRPPGHGAPAPAFDEPQGRLYLADTALYIVDVFDLDPLTGTLAGRRRFLDFSEAQVWPDSMTVDDEGMLWVALGRAGAVHRYRADGTLDGVVELPTTSPASVAFGDIDGAIMYITAGLPAARLDEQVLEVRRLTVANNPARRRGPRHGRQLGDALKLGCQTDSRQRSLAEKAIVQPGERLASAASRLEDTLSASCPPTAPTGSPPVSPPRKPKSAQRAAPWLL